MSGWRSKKQMSNDRFNISYSWTQPYREFTNVWAAGSTGKSKLSTEMAVIEAIDRLVESKLTHPDADAILMKLKQL